MVYALAFIGGVLLILVAIAALGLRALRDLAQAMIASSTMQMFGGAFERQQRADLHE